jgi:3',5'-cyclic AMP phosphodiesterase CpdA
MRTLVHLSDLHFGRLDARIVAPLVRTINEVSPDLIAVSGDLTQRARRSQFLEAREFLSQLPQAQLVVPGNHDVPLFNLPGRFLRPFGAYRRYITADLEPVFHDDEMMVIGMNSARTLPLHGGGRLSAPQVGRAAARFQSAPADALRIVVTHHPFDLPAGHDRKHLIGRSAMAMAQLAHSGADLFLAGHLHVSHVGRSAERYQIAGHSALVVQAGTLSTRGRGEANSFNVLRLHRPAITVERHVWDGEHGAFTVDSSAEFRHTADGWL